MPGRNAVHPAIPWHERANKIHLGDRRFVPLIVSAVQELRKVVHGRPVEIASRQAGLVMFYTSGALGDGQRFVDECGLATTEVTTCPKLRGIHRTSVGVNLELASILTPAVRSGCGIDPDVIFDLMKSKRSWRRAPQAPRGARISRRLWRSSRPRWTADALEPPPRTPRRIPGRAREAHGLSARGGAQTLIPREAEMTTATSPGSATTDRVIVAEPLKSARASTTR